MPQHAPGSARRHPTFVPGRSDLDGQQRIGESALDFGKWFAQSKYRLMGEFTAEFLRPPSQHDPVRLRGQFSRALAHGQRVHQVRAFVTVLLAIGLGTAASTAVANALMVGDLFAQVAAIAASLTIALLIVRLALDRYLERVDVTATFLAIQLASAPK